MTVFTDQYYSVIITYNPDLNRIKKNIDNLLRQGSRIIVVDTNSENVDLISKISGIQLIRLKSNKGIATALNVGMDQAGKNGNSWVLSLDQDTEIAPNLLHEYKNALKKKDDIGALSPQVIKRGESVFKDNNLLEKIDKCPTSGFFMTTDLWKKLGKYNEWMFIDYVDYDMCIRIRTSGLSIYRVGTTYILQELGKLHVNKFFYSLGTWLHINKLKNFALTYNHSPFRNYYYVRNALYYINKYSDSLDVRYEKNHLIKWEMKKFFLERNKIKNIKAALKGIHDYRLLCKRKSYWGR